mgnify:CR=1 FL=1
MAQGRSDWWHPSLGGVSVDGAPLPHWIGALFIALLSPWVDPILAVRIPFALLLALSLAAVWYATFHLARTEAAQPVAFAFGGEASTVDYARAIADGALLALIATLGLVHLGHEITPEIVQTMANAGCQAICFGVESGNQEVLDLVRAELADVAAGGLTREEFERAKGHTKGSIVLSLENPGSRMSRLGRTEISEAEPLTVTQLLRRFDDVTLRDAREAAERVLTRPLALTVLGPFSKGAVA